MQNLSVRRQNALKAASKNVSSVREYRITDPHHQPDIRGELGGVKVIRRGSDQIVRMTEKQAQWWIDQGAITPV